MVTIEAVNLALN